MTTINPYLNYNGTAEEAFNLYKSVFGGEFGVVARMKDTPPQPWMENLSESDQNKIMHISLTLPNGSVLMASDVLESSGFTVEPGNLYNLSITAESEEEADSIFKALSEGGTVRMAMEKTFWGAYFGMCTDRYGIQWMINYDYPRE